MSLRQDRLTFFGVLVAVVIAVLGYLQLGSMYPLQGRAEDSASSSDDQTDKTINEETNKQNADHDKSPARDGAGGP